MEDARADYGSITADERLTADEMDSKRSQAIAYEYLCHLEEAKQWMEFCLQEELPPSTELEESLRNGVSLAKLGHYFAPEVVPARKIYDRELKRFEQKGLHFKHTDNINRFFTAMEHVGLPKIFYPETTDIYDRKNMPRTIYCLHALSLYLFKLGKAPQMKDLYGIAEFTEEQVSIMQTELEKYGINLPQFNKIGGILANEMSVDEASLHAAVIAINEALEAGDAEETLNKLNNPQATLTGVSGPNAQVYQERLLKHKRTKAEAAKNKAKDKSEEDEEERDMYEELLTHAEVQGNLNKINLDVKLEELNELLGGEVDGSSSSSKLIDLLKSIGVSGVEESNETWYRHQLMHDLDSKKEKMAEEDGVKLEKEEIQTSVNTANQLASKHRFRKTTVANINSLLTSGDDPEKLVHLLADPELDLPPVFTEAPLVHYKELSAARSNKESELNHDELSSLLPRVNALAKVNKRLESGDVAQIWDALTSHLLQLNGLDESCRTRICDALMSAKEQNDGYLTTDQLQENIDVVNEQVAEEQARMEGVKGINDALNGDLAALLEALQNPHVKLDNVDATNILHYSRLLSKKKEEKKGDDDEEGVSLWIDEVQQAVDLANQHAKAALKQASAVAAVNMAIEDSEWEECYEMLKHPDLALTALTFECGSTYYDSFKMVKDEKAQQGKMEMAWVLYKTREGDDFYFNVDTLEGKWEKPENFNPEAVQLSKDEIQSVVNDVSAAYDRCQFYKDNEDQIVKLQSFARMCIAKRSYNERKNFMDNQLPAIVTIQAAWRGHQQRSKYLARLDYLRQNEKAVITLQKFVRMWRMRRLFNNRLNYLRSQASHIVKLQAWFRSNKARHDYKTLIGVENPPLPVVQRFVHLLDQRATDFAEEIELQELKQSVIQRIKANNEHEKALNSMDIKIGLLVKNRISLQDVINHSHNLRKKTAKELAAGDGNQGLVATGLKALNKANRARLEAYQHLFYMLQTNPTYFGKLIFKMPVGKSTDFMQQVIFAVYNYASNSREEYLLLKLFRTALQEEIDFIAGEDPGSKVDKVKEIATGNPLVIKMVVSFNRGAKGNSSLRQILAPQVSEVMKIKSNINTSPLEIYKAWISQQETETGEASTLPYNVSIQEALEHEEVRKRMGDSVERLRAATEGFMNAIVSNLDSIPYGLRYIAKCLRNLLTNKFPETADEEVLKMVGNLIYYRFINPAIISPDVFDIIDVAAGAGGALNNDQRKNLGSIAKVLQFASTGKFFVGDMDYLNSINDYLKDAYTRFKNFFKAVCDVPEPEEKHNMDEFSDAVLLVKPVIFISLKEVVDTHKLLVEHEEEIAPDANDPLHDMLEELGEVPTYSTLLGSSHRGSPHRESKKENHSSSNNQQQQQNSTTTTSSAGSNEQQDSKQEEIDNEAIKAEISLTLASRVEIAEDDDSDIKNLLLRTKRMVIDIIRIQGKENLKLLLNTPASEEQEELHMANISKLEKQRVDEQQEEQSKEQAMLKTRSLLNENKLPLEDMKRRVVRNLEKLQQHDIVSEADNYQSLVNMIARDIRNQRRYRQRRKQELSKLKQNEQRLEQKSDSLAEQSEYFNKYIKSCLESLNAKSKQQKKKKKKNNVLKYTAAELKRKKVVLEIDGLDNNREKDVLFEISQSDDDVGKFVVAAKFFGVNMEKVTIVFQDLLQLQYEGASHMKMFEGKARVNVNLLIFLLNKKFYGK